MDSRVAEITVERVCRSEAEARQYEALWLRCLDEGSRAAGDDVPDPHSETIVGHPPLPDGDGSDRERGGDE
jgi:hypothetical protein